MSVWLMFSVLVLSFLLLWFYLGDHKPTVKVHTATNSITVCRLVFNESNWLHITGGDNIISAIIGQIIYQYNAFYASLVKDMKLCVLSSKFYMQPNALFSTIGKMWCF